MFKHGSWIAEKNISDLCGGMQVFHTGVQEWIVLLCKKKP